MPEPAQDKQQDDQEQGLLEEQGLPPLSSGSSKLKLSQGVSRKHCLSARTFH